VDDFSGGRPVEQALNQEKSKEDHENRFTEFPFKVDKYAVHCGESRRYKTGDISIYASPEPEYEKYVEEPDGELQQSRPCVAQIGEPIEA
jgi:hypothetical protein